MLLERAETEGGQLRLAGVVPNRPPQRLVTRLRACNLIDAEHDRDDRCGGAQQPRKVGDGTLDASCSMTPQLAAESGKPKPPSHRFAS